MGEPSDDPILATAALTRLWLAADRLGIDAAPLQQRVGEVVPAIAAGAWVSLDSDDRLAICCTQTAAGPGVPIPRTAYARRFELELDREGQVAEVVTALGRRAYTDDQRVLAEAGIPSEVIGQLGELVDVMGDGSCDGLARRRATTGETWFGIVAYDAISPGPEADDVRDLTGARLVSLANAIAVHPAQVAILAQLHAHAHRGFSVTFELGARGLVPVLRVAYTKVPWPDVVRVAERLRPVPAQAPRLGTFAGAFAAPHASTLELAYVPNGVARVRVWVDAT
ncbi:MAG TPA: hypothetical protein VM513_36185 [Kofleriaceae bacterium]|nr:hypothetical protein [Kofleriaceae bacterium]